MQSERREPDANENPYSRERLHRENTALRAEIERLRDREGQFVNALIWCSVSADFNEGGQAREGWLKMCRPLIEAALKGPSHDAG